MTQLNMDKNAIFINQKLFLFLKRWFLLNKNEIILNNIAKNINIIDNKKKSDNLNQKLIEVLKFSLLINNQDYK
jgi:hypothetical protein